MMLAILQIVLRVFAMVALGFVAQRTGRVSAEGVRAINDLMFLLALPSLLFWGVVTNVPSGATLVVALAYFAGCLPVYTLALALVLGPRSRGLRLTEADVLAPAATYDNLVMTCIPLVVAA